MATPAIESLQNGKLLQIMFSEGVRNQLSRDSRDWDMVKMMKVDDARGRQLNYMISTGYGPSAIQYRNSGSSTNFPPVQRVSTQELTAEYKNIELTIDISHDLWKRLQQSKEVRYFDILALELQNKMDAAKRQFSKDLYGDGTGALGVVSTATDDTSGDTVTIVLSTADTAVGGVGMFESGEIVTFRAAAGTRRDPSVVTSATLVASAAAGQHLGWRVKSRNRSANSIVLESVDITGTVLTTWGASNIVAGDFAYKVGQPTGGHDAALNRSTITDYGFATEVMTGLESMSQNDGRVLNGLTMSGFTGGSRFDAGGVAIDSTHLQAALDNAKINAGEGSYAYKRMIMAPETHAAFINSRETDRRFISVEDNTRGTRYFAFQHRTDSLETYGSEYCPKNRIYMLPENKATKEKVIEYYGTDFEPVKVNDSGSFHLKVGANGYERNVQHFMDAYCQLVVKHPAAVASVHNFIVP